VFQDPPEGLTFGSLPLGPVLVIPLLALVVRRLSWGDLQNDPFMAASALRLR
jgi:hypothetical protein